MLHIFPQIILLVLGQHHTVVLICISVMANDANLHVLGFLFVLSLANYTPSSGFVFLFFISLRWSLLPVRRKWPTAQGDHSAGKTSSCRSLTTQASDVVANAHTPAGRWETETGDCLEAPEPASLSTVHRQESLKLNKEERNDFRTLAQVYTCSCAYMGMVLLVYNPSP